MSGAAAWLALAVRHGCDGELSDSQPVALPQPMTVLLVSDAIGQQANTQVESVPPAATVWALPA